MQDPGSTRQTRSSSILCLRMASTCYSHNNTNENSFRGANSEERLERYLLSGKPANVINIMNRQRILNISDVPHVVYVNQVITISLSYTDEESKFICGQNPPVSLTLQCEGDVASNNWRHALNIHESDKLTISSNGRAAFDISISQLSKGRSFVLVAHLQDSPYLKALSQPFVVVSSCLVVTRSLFPQPVYNDNKGDKYLNIPVQLLGANGQMVHGREVPLKVTLRYTNGELVRPTYPEKQPTLIMLQPENPRLEVDGNCVIKARIMQITRNHNNNQFMIRIEPDLSTHSENSDIGYGECGPFEVRTKCSDVEAAKRKAEALAAQKVKHQRQEERESNRTIKQEEPVPYHTLASITAHLDNHNVLKESTFGGNGITQQFDDFATKVQSLKWRPAGYDTVMNADGEIERTKRVYYQPPNPNDYITYLLRHYGEVLRPMLLLLTQQQQHFSQNNATHLPSPLPSIADPKTISLESLAQFPPKSFNANLPDKQISNLSNFSNFSLTDIEYFNPEQLTVQDMERIFSPSCVDEDDVHILVSGKVWHSQSSPSEEAVCFICLSQCVMKAKGLEFGLPALNRNMEIIGFIRPGRFKRTEFVPLCSLSIPTQDRIRSVASTYIKKFTPNLIIQIREFEELEEFASYAVEAWSKEQLTCDIGE